MKKILLGILLTISAVPAMAETAAENAIDVRPCQAVAVDRYNRVIARFYGQTDRNGMCRNALRNCNMEVRRRGWWGVRCTQLRTRW